MNIVKVVWKDHYSNYGWHPVRNFPTPAGHLNVTVGFLIDQNKDFITVAQTIFADEEQCADLLHIITKDIIKTEVLN